VTALFSVQDFTGKMPDPETQTLQSPLESLHPAQIGQRLTESQVTTYAVGQARHAAVALILEPCGDDWSVLFIERAHRDGDPWSGQIAFPGGRREKHDLNEEAVALRETEEEIGVTIDASQCIGRLDDLKGRHGGTSEGMVISCFVYAIDHLADVFNNYEVANVVRLPMSHLLSHQNYVTVAWREKNEMRYPGVGFGERDSRVVWGLTYRFLRQFFDRLGHHLPKDALDGDEYRVSPF